MSFFKGDEAIAIVKVPEELYQEIVHLGNEVGKLYQEDQKSGNLIINATNGLEKKYRIHFNEADRRSFLFREKDDEYKLRFLAQYSGACIPDDEDDLVNSLTQYMKETIEEFDQQDIKIADKVWEAQARKPHEMTRTRVRKADVWSEDKLKERLFQLFEDNDSVSFDSLREKTNAAKAILEKSLKEIADFSKDDKTFRLKEQYRRTSGPGSQATKKVKTT